MRCFDWKNWLVCGAAGAAVALGGAAARGQEDVLVPGGPIDLIVRPLDEAARLATDVLVAAVADEGGEESPEENKYWLGVQIAPVPDLAKRHLSIEEGLVVEDVTPESPAAKAEIKRHDILLKAGDTPLKDAGDLVKSVEASQGKEMTMTLLRDGKRTQVVVTATRRPAGERVDIRLARRPELAEEIKRLEEVLEKLRGKAGDGSIGWWFAKPGVVTPRVENKGTFHQKFELKKAEFPKDLVIDIRKEGDKPAKVRVQRGDQQWEVSEDDLKELPDWIRPHVQRYLDGQGAAAGALAPAIAGPPGSRTIRVLPGGKVEGEIRIQPVAPAPPVPPVPPVAPLPPRLAARAERGEPAEPKLDIIIQKLDQLETGALARLDKEVKQIRKELDELRTKSPGDAQK